MYLLDTCAFIWYLGNSQKLSEKAKNIIEKNHGIFLSIVALWEISIKKTIRKIEIPENTFQLARACKKEEIKILPIKLKYIERIQKLPLLHGDPFDRIIMATAIEEDLTIVTSDSKIKQYSEINCVW